MTIRARLLRVVPSALVIALFATAPAQAASVQKRNVVDLIAMAELIFVGEVVTVTDGLDGKVPYTEITVRVRESLRGYLGSTFTFRQFGLLAPRVMGNGTVNLNVTPEGWPRFTAGEQVMLFLYKPGAITGLRTTVGLFQGKFGIRRNQLKNAIDNLGLFDNIAVESGLLTDKEQQLLTTVRGAVSPEIFVPFVRRVVHEGWIEAGKIRHAR